MDSMDAINSEILECEELSVPPNHPGKDDVAYLRRRRMFFYLAREHRLRSLSSPPLEYTEAEERLWRETYLELDELHQKSAANLFKAGKQALGLTPGEIPQLAKLEPRLKRATGVTLVPAEGLLHAKIYFEYWAKRIMPCTQFLRHGAQPHYTPEPDIIHDVIGHVPPLMDAEYARLIEGIGKATRGASPEKLERIVRFYWFSVEFGLVEEEGQLRILGAGILSSIQETKNILAGKVELRKFDVDEIVNRQFDTTHLQPVLYVAPSLRTIVDAARVILAG
jgi:phenylalanine-4-hydroxylase